MVCVDDSAELLHQHISLSLTQQPNYSPNINEICSKILTLPILDLPREVTNSNPTPSDPPISTEHCDWLYGIFGHETSCTRYWTCWNGTATEQFCIGGLLYNEETHACDWPQNVAGCQKHRECYVLVC